MTEPTPLPNIPYASETEKKIVGKLVADLLAAGCFMSVYDGEVTTVKNSTDGAVIFAALSSTDSDWLVVNRHERNLGSILLIWGNDVDVISDYSAKLDESLIAGAMALAEELT